MGNCKFSKEADKDISQIYEYTFLNFGIKQAQQYSNSLYSKIQLLASGAIKGRNVDIIKPDLKRLEVGSHIILYFENAEYILINRILNNRMDIKKHL